MSETQEYTGQSLGKFWPPELQEPAFDLMMQFNKAALQAETIIDSVSPQTSEVISKIGQVSTDIAILLRRRIVPSEMARLESEFLAQKVKNEAQEFNATRSSANISKSLIQGSRILSRAAINNFWKNVEAPVAQARPGRTSEWGVSIFEHFVDRPLTSTDLTKIIFAEEIGTTYFGTLQSNITSGVVRSPKVKFMLTERKLKITRQLKGGQPRYWYMCTSIDNLDPQFDPELQPSDDELRELAIRLRQQDLEKSTPNRLELQTDNGSPGWKDGEEVQVMKEVAQEDEKNPWGLTVGEEAIFKLLPVTDDDAAIAKELYLSCHTVRAHIKKIYSKTGVNNRTLATTLAYNTHADELAEQVEIKLDQFWLLTKTERNVLLALSQGLSNDEASEACGIKSATVITHTKHIYGKLGIKRIQAGIYVQKAQEAGLFDTEITSPKRNAPAGTRRREKSNATAPRDKEYRSQAVSPLMHFRTDVIKSLSDIVKAMPEYERPAPGQTFVMPKAEVLLSDLLKRGLITPEQFAKAEIDRAAVVAAVLIKTGRDRGFLDGGKAQEGLATIREEEEKFLKLYK